MITKSVNITLGHKSVPLESHSHPEWYLSESLPNSFSINLSILASSISFDFLIHLPFSPILFLLILVVIMTIRQT